MDRDITLDADTLMVVLTDSQRLQLAPIVRKAAQDNKGVIFFTAAPFFDAGKQHWRLQAKFLPWKAANKVLKIIREAETEAT